MNYMSNNIINKIAKYVVLINIIVIISYKIGADIAAKWNLLFRGWIDILYMINVMAFIIIAIASTNVFLYSKIKNHIVKNAWGIISALVMVIIAMYGLIIFAFAYKPEHVVYEQNQKVIAKVVSVGFHYTQVDFYEPVNIFLMRKSNIPSKRYKGSYDMYEKRKSPVNIF